MSEALKQFHISFTNSSSWVGVANNVKSSASGAYVKIMPGTSGANFYCYSPSYDNGEMVFWIAIGY